MEFEFIEKFTSQDLEVISRAINAVLSEGGGINRWLHPIPPLEMKNYWQSIENNISEGYRYLCVARLNSEIVGAAQLLVSPNPTNDIARHTGQIRTVFVAPWARRRGLARGMLQVLEKKAISLDIETLELDVRASQVNAVKLYESEGFVRWGIQPAYAKIEGHYFKGFYYIKFIKN